MDKAWIDWTEVLSDPKSTLETILIGFTRCSPRYEISNRTLNEHLIYQIVENDIHAEFANGERIIAAGDLLWVPPGHQHAFRPAQAGTQILVYHYRFISEPGWPISEEVILSSNANNRIGRFSSLHDGSDDQDPQWKIRFRSSLVLTFCEIAEVCKQQGQIQTTLSADQRKQIVQAVHDDPWIDPERLAILLDYHPAYFTRLFKRSLGHAPRTWLVQQRMQRAANMLLEQSTSSIADIAEEIGYHDPFLFSRQFKQFLGCSPRHWRQQHVGPKQETY